MRPTTDANAHRPSDRRVKRHPCRCPLCESSQPSEQATLALERARLQPGDTQPEGVLGAAWVPLVRAPRTALVACFACRRSVPNVSSLLRGWQESGTRHRVYRCPACAVAEREGKAEPATVGGRIVDV